MDHLIYTAMSAATTLLDRQAVVSNNLANADTSGFRADISVFQQAPITGKGMQTRTQVASGSSGVDFTPGAVQATGRPLDVALPGKGFLAVQAADGNEAYTRSGSLQIAADGTLVTSTGLAVLGDGGPISVPPDTTVSIAADGTVSGISTAPPFTAPTPLGQIKLVNPATNNLAKGADGLFRTKDGSDAAVDPTVSLTSGALESSNVNTAEVMVSMIDLARSFEQQMKMLQAVQDNSQHADQLLSTS